MPHDIGAGAGIKARNRQASRSTLVWLATVLTVRDSAALV